jgi:hypothetical protein
VNLTKCEADLIAHVRHLRANHWESRGYTIYASGIRSASVDRYLEASFLASAALGLLRREDHRGLESHIRHCRD